ncbi:uncharacterized protein LOC143915064 [Arctopsyche grandis]|uniref:uncharacterized protein LOC143915064 n=1 Tax=Arctopsyche grandis TaxID=121162 RepID=UPI00406D684C
MKCRLCLRSAPDESFVNIYDESNSILQYIQSCCQLDMERYDGLPDAICSSCVYSLKLINNFKIICIKNNESARLQLAECSGVKMKKVILDDSWEGDNFDTNTLNKESDARQFNDLDKSSDTYDEDDGKHSQVDETHIGTDQITEKIEITPTVFSVTESLDIELQITPHRCDICLKYFKTKRILKQHISIHTSEKRHKCETCSKSFFKRSNLINHIRIHNGEKPYKCERCSKCFVTTSSLNKHMKLHTGEKPHKCEICSKSFVAKGILKYHIKSHTGEKPHECKICSKSFITQSNLKQHVMYHTGEKPHKCNVCSKCFVTTSNLKQHMKIAHKSNTSH